VPRSEPPLPDFRVATHSPPRSGGETASPDHPTELRSAGAPVGSAAAAVPTRASGNGAGTGPNAGRVEPTSSSAGRGPSRRR
jgi:hypothetical protein